MKRTKPSIKKRTGPKGYWNSGITERAYRLCLLGLTDNELALAFGININTLAYWKRTKPTFKAALQSGKQEADSRVARSLYQRACGYSHKDVHITTSKTKTGTEIIATPITKYYPPDTAAAIFWLTNRQAENWSNTQRIEHRGNIALKRGPVDLSDLTRDELLLLKKLGLKQIPENVSDN